eukprot:NODE_83_length_22457_cov_0.375794.p13 type:complete len:123 gc:universal NODE_83_length_22457_cov_0.375794:1300-932(-)
MKKPSLDNLKKLNFIQLQGNNLIRNNRNNVLIESQIIELEQQLREKLKSYSLADLPNIQTTSKKGKQKNKSGNAQPKTVSPKRPAEQPEGHGSQSNKQRTDLKQQLSTTQGITIGPSDEPVL